MGGTGSWLQPLGAPPHLHGEVGRKHQQAQALDALCQATGRVPGLRAVADIRGAGERGRGLNKSQRQDQENDEAQEPGKGPKQGENVRTGHTRGQRADRRAEHPQSSGTGRDHVPAAATPWSGDTDQVETQLPWLTGMYGKEPSPEKTSSLLGGSFPKKAGDLLHRRDRAPAGALGPASPTPAGPWEPQPPDALTIGSCMSSTSGRATSTRRPCGG